MDWTFYQERRGHLLERCRDMRRNYGRDKGYHKSFQRLLATLRSDRPTN